MVVGYQHGVEVAKLLEAARERARVEEDAGAVDLDEQAGVSEVGDIHAIVSLSVAERIHAEHAELQGESGVVADEGAEFESRRWADDRAEPVPVVVADVATRHQPGQFGGRGLVPVGEDGNAARPEFGQLVGR